MDATDWSDYYEETAASFQDNGRDRVAAESAAYGQCLNAMYVLQVEPMPGRCAGCGEAIGVRPSDTYTIGGETVHADRQECRIEHGRKWRTQAADRLKTLGIKRPEGCEL